MIQNGRRSGIFFALLVVWNVLAAISASAAVNRTNMPALKDIYYPYFLIGTTFSSANDINTDPGEASVAAKKRKHFNAVTPENFTKPEQIWSQGPNGNPIFVTNPNATANTAVAMANTNGYYTIGHALAWHNQSNRWPIGDYLDLSTNTWDHAEAKVQLERYIKTVVENYNDPAHYFDAWDVVNEAFKDNPSNPTDWRNALRGGYNPEERSARWALAYSKGGNSWDYMYDAFIFARKYTQAILNYNDFNDLENDAKATAIASMVKEFNERYARENPDDPRKLVEVIGVQAHYDLRLNLDALERNIKKYLDLGVKVELTELDVTIPMALGKNVRVPDTEFSDPMNEFYKEQGVFYAKLMLLLKKYAHYKEGISRVSWWGVGDGSNWRSSGRPMLWTRTHEPKEAYWATIQPEEYLKEVSMTPGSPATFTYGGKSYTVSTWGGKNSFAELDISVPAGTSSIDFTAEGNVFPPAGFSVSGVTFSPTDGVVGGGEPCVVTVKAVSAANPNNTATYKLTFAWDEDSTKTEKAWRLAKTIRSGRTYVIVSAETDQALTNKSKVATTGVPVSLSRTPVTVSGDILVFDGPEQENLKFIFEERTSSSPGQYADQTGHTLQCLVHATNAYPGVVFRGTIATDSQYELISRTTNGSEGPHVADRALDQAVWFNTDIDPVTGETRMFLYTGSADKHYVLKEVEEGDSTADRWSITKTVGGFVALESDDPTADATKVRLYEYVIEPYSLPVDSDDGERSHIGGCDFGAVGSLMLILVAALWVTRKG
ncbi:MAG: endo-1,4-beta-xylanase [Synergistaceae bacterium]|jgi:GH35 family endo-1,4-beta-xylanase|nr:endo-1,4-beta-xylanase [Synergistaceae bacterium]